MDYHSLSDTELIDGCITQPTNREMLNVFVGRFSKSVYQTISWILLRHAQVVKEDVDDVFQEIFVNLLKDGCRALKKYDYTKARFSTYLLTITKNRTINYIRQKWRRNVVLHEEFMCGGDFSDDLLEFKERKEMLDKAVSDLSPKDRLFFKLYYKDSLPPDKIALVLGISKDSVYAKKAKLIHKLKTSLSKNISKSNKADLSKKLPKIEADYGLSD
ncbi:MAG: sigma-70 family RNA polymerase sigma factor [Chitinivibrionales bacterium]|nr:sigma-70 family RNA polymerase sigma factor [Chitinivibrionales bacterium]